MPGADPLSLINGSPSFSLPSSATSGATSVSGSISSSFQDGSFAVGGSQSLNLLFIIVGVVVVMFILYGGKR